MVDRFKQALRQTCLRVRKTLSQDYQNKASHRVCAQISQLEPYRYAKRIALYHPVNGELDLGRIWHSAPLHGKYCYFPVLNDDKTLSFLPATPRSMFQKNRFGINEPQVPENHTFSPNELDIIFVPLVAFDKNGTRLGMGAGYYDRTLAHARPKLLVGVAYEFQLQSFIAADEWDVPLHVIITECNVYWAS